MRGNKKTRLTLFPSVFLLLAVLLSACGQQGNAGSQTKAADNKQVLVSSLVGGGISDIGHFDPALATDLYSARAIQTVFTGLVSLDKNDKIQPQMASSWEKSSDGLTWTFHLKNNLKFSDGTPIDASTYIWSLDRALKPETKSPSAPFYLANIKDADKLNNGDISTLEGNSLLAPDANTLVIKLNQPVPFFLFELVQPCAYPVEKALVEKYGKAWTDHLNEGGTSGPFKVLHYIHQKELAVVSDENYYGAKPQLKEIIFPFYKELDATYQDYQANKLDDTRIPLVNYEQAKKSKEFTQHPTQSINYYTMNYKQKPFDNVHIRQAFALAINKQKIVDKIWKGSYIATNHIVPQGSVGYNKDLTGPAGVKGTTGDQKKARELLQQGLQEEGWTSVSQMPAINLSYSSAGAQVAKDEVTEMLQQWHDVLGVTVNANDIDINTLFDNEGKGANNPLSFYSGPGWIGDYPDPQDWTSLQFEKGMGQNGMNYGQNDGKTAAQQQALQDRMLKADVMQDDTKRIAEYQAIEQQLVNDVAWFPMEQQNVSTLIKSCVQNLQTNTMGLIDPEGWKDVYITTNSSCANQTVSNS